MSPGDIFSSPGVKLCILFLLTRHMRSDGTRAHAVNEVRVICYHKLVFCEINVGTCVVPAAEHKASSEITWQS